MLKTLGTFLATIAKTVASKAAAAAGPAAKSALVAMDPEFDFKVRCFSKDSRLHAVATLDASLNLPGELDTTVAGVVNSSGLIGLGNSAPTSSEPGDSPSN